MNNFSVIPASPQGISVIVVDDHEATRLGLRAVFSQISHVTLLGEARTGEEGYDLFQQLKPDVLILDMRLPGAGGLQALHRVISSDPDAKVVIYTGYEDQYLLSESLKNGALGFVSKGNSVRVLIQAVCEVAEGHLFISQDLMQARNHLRKTAQVAEHETLSPREKEIFLLLAQGYSAKDCSAQLHLSSKTVSNYATTIKFKLGVSNQAELARLAIKLGLLGS